MLRIPGKCVKCKQNVSETLSDVSVSIKQQQRMHKMHFSSIVDACLYFSPVQFQ